MKSPSIDSFYIDINDHINLVESYTEINNIATIIKACRLKPHDYLFKQKTNKIKLFKWWIDEFNNSLYLNKEIDIVYSDLKSNKTISTDLYYGLSINKIVNISSLAYICAGKDEDTYKDFAIITFLGLDNYLRSYMFMYGEWAQVSPLLIGIDNLQNLFKGVGTSYFQKLKNKKNSGMPCEEIETWLTSLPVSDDFIADLNKQYENINVFK